MIQAQEPFYEESFVGLMRPGAGGWYNSNTGRYHVIGVTSTSAGTIIAWSDYRRVPEDGGQSDVVITRKLSTKSHWEETKVISTNTAANNLFINVLEVHDPITNAKKLLLFYAERPERHENTDGTLEPFVNSTKLFVLEGTNEGAEWNNARDLAPVLVNKDFIISDAILQGQAPAEFTGEDYSLYARQAFFPGPGNAIQLSANHPTAPYRILVPILALKERNDAPLEAKGYGNAVLYSDDGGRTWNASIIPIGSSSSSHFPYQIIRNGQVSQSGQINYFNNNEASIVELANGNLLLNARTVQATHSNGTSADWNYRRSKSTSSDGGLSWTLPKALVNDGVPLYVNTHSGLLRYSKAPNGLNRLLFSHPNNPYVSNLGDSRKKMTVRLSYNEHDSWELAREIYSEGSHYSNMAMLEEDILLIYGQGQDYDNKAYPARIVMGRFNLAWLSNRHDDPILGRATPQNNWTFINPSVDATIWPTLQIGTEAHPVSSTTNAANASSAIYTINPDAVQQDVRLYLRIPVAASTNNRSEAVKVIVHHIGGDKEIFINQKVSHGLWMHLGEYTVLGGKVSLSNVEVNGNIGAKVIAGQVAYELL